MILYKVAKPDVSSISAEGHEFDVVNGFIEVAEEIHLPALEKALLMHAGCVLAKLEEVDAAVASSVMKEGIKAYTDERTRLLDLIRTAGLKIDGRKGLDWVRERFSEFVEQGFLHPDGSPVKAPEPPADPAAQQPETPATPGPDAPPASDAAHQAPEGDPAGQSGAA